MNRKLLMLAALAGVVLALLFGDLRSDHDCIRLITQEELPQAQVLRSVRRGTYFAIFFELPANEAEELCHRLPTRDGWLPLLPDKRFGLTAKVEDDISGLSDSYARVAGNYGGALAYLIRSVDGKTLVAILSHCSI